MPNISGFVNPELGYTDGRRYQLAVETYSGALKYRSLGGWTANGVEIIEYGEFNCGLSFDASLSNPIYKNSNSVQPSSFRVLIIVRT